MTLLPNITRQKYMTEHGHQAEYVTIHPGLRPPQSVAEWVEQAIVRLGRGASTPPGQIVVRLLGDDPAAVKAGKGLNADQRYAVARTLGLLCDRASEDYPHARGLVVRARRAWVAAYGDDVPQVIS